jgi:hypothetical protein
VSQIYKASSGGSGPLPPNVATTYQANTGTATPALNILNVLGSNGATTTASGNTLTINPGFTTSQFVSSSVLKTAPITLTNNLSQTITSITLQPGQWSLSAIVEVLSANQNELIAAVDISISTVNNTLSGIYGLSDFNEILLSGNEAATISIPGYQVTIVVPTTYFMVVNSTFTLPVIAFGTLSAIGQLATGAGNVTSITGTASQIAASSSTGAVTLSIPSTFLAPGSIEATTTLKADGIFTTASGQIVNVTTPGAYPYTTQTSDYVILVDSSVARTIIPLAAPTTGTTYRIKDNTGSAQANNITITPSGKNIDGAASFIISTNFGAIDIVYNGTQWNIL